MAIVIRGEEMAFRHVANYPHIDPVTRSHILVMISVLVVVKVFLVHSNLQVC
jgi:hypothetical protein